MKQNIYEIVKILKNLLVQKSEAVLEYEDMLKKSGSGLTF